MLARPADFFVIYTKQGGRELALKLRREPATWVLRWFDPRNGGELQRGSVTEIVTTEPEERRQRNVNVKLGQPPSAPERDWVILVRKAD